LARHFRRGLDGGLGAALMEGIGVVGGGSSDADGEELQAFGSSLRRRDRGRIVHGPELLDLRPMHYIHWEMPLL
jgi:hypothetical protein